ncbi:cytochrome P450 [Acrocarpospora phusangensis]|uniref:Cytochrome P450 n=1 Tax=Acrocarpospora phusangensis TaxID=1070424 RepID=A0A919QAX4_9ACTN|nr:cytochrome P450 [Acrocarpospora phusangensis]GIH25298.1 cytochrome P450 [Acrocarpospora phusangensis]
MTDEFRPYELWEPDTRRDPHAFYARVRAAGRPIPQIDPAGDRFWIVARHADVLDGLQHPAIGHEVREHQAQGPALAHHRTEAERIAARQLIDLDPPDHTRLRGLVSKAFTARTVAKLEPWIGDVADQLVARALRLGTFDGVADLADPLPVNVIAQLVGVPEEDRAQFRAWSATIVSGSDQHGVATLAFAAYIDELAARRRAVPADDLLSELVALEAQGDALDRDELVAMVQLLLIAGQETTVDVIVNGIRLLLTHPEQWQDLRADPSLASALVEETLRYRGPVEIVPPRFTFRDLDIAGGTIPAFERVGLSLWGANRDPSVFADPDVFDIHRPDVHRHIAFGHGIHFCLGASLGRLEARIMFDRIARELPRLRLAVDPDDVDDFRLHWGSLPLRIPT